MPGTYSYTINAKPYYNRIFAVCQVFTGKAFSMPERNFLPNCRQVNAKDHYFLIPV